MQKTILLLDSHAEIFIKVAQSVTESLISHGEKIEIWDISSLGYPQWGALSSSELEAAFDEPAVKVVRKELFRPSEIFRGHPDSIRQQIDFYSLERHMGDFQGRKISRFLLRNYLKGTIGAAKRIASEISSETEKVGKILIRNGRSPWQHALRSELQNFTQIELGYYDFPFFWGKDYSFLGPHPIHDRVSYQTDSGEVNRSYDESFVQEWRDNHRQQMQSKWGFKKQTDQFKVAIMSSSTFEFISMPDVWNTGVYKDQYEGFSKALRILDPSGEGSIIRIHPNLQNAPWRVQLSDVARVRWLKKNHPNLKIVWHFEESNSYDLVQNSDFVVVSISTIGLEGIAMGKPVLAVGSTFYDIVCDVTFDTVHRRNLNREKEGAAQILGHLRLLSLPVGSFTDKRSRGKRILDSLLHNPAMSLYTFHLELVNSWSSKFGVWLARNKFLTDSKG